MKRGDVAEDIVDGILAPEWNYVGASGAGWDFENAAGVRIQLKQSALLQTWVVAKPKPRFKIAPQALCWAAVGNEEYKPIAPPAPTRFADIYIFAYHGVGGPDADQCDPAQWRFYVVPTAALPETQTLPLARARQLSPEYDQHTLLAAVEQARHSP